MCRVKQFAFSCGHPATESFRYRLCQAPGTETCMVIDDRYDLNSPCHRCIRWEARRTTQNFQEIENLTARGWEETNRRVFYNGDSALDFEWHVPSRCFIDVGFRSLDPFGDDKKKQLRLAATGMTETREEERQLAPDELEDDSMEGHSGDMMEIDEQPVAEERRPLSIRLLCIPPSNMEQQTSTEEQQQPRRSSRLRRNKLSTGEQSGPSTIKQKRPVSIKLHCNRPKRVKKRPRTSIKLNCKRSPTKEQQGQSSEKMPPRISIKLNCSWLGKVAPCCVRQKQQGPDYATRPEDVEERREGRLAGNTCTSGF
ncbi:hypothetical protein LTR84_003359 [Exophiala bonariae]|uniref:Uncharacterized protein n=1 Tax=Exophiala bonariae TaxID=1690606 RepID=A0AAV9N7L1_9EURO|nr:hypothetical protein LTR84_003359 [Exophiala bonariae]